MAREDVRGDAAYGGVGMREQRTRPTAQRGIGIGRGLNSLQRLQGLGDDPTVGIGELARESVACPRGRKSFRRDTTPAPIGVGCNRRGGGDTSRAVCLREREERLALEREYAA